MLELGEQEFVVTISSPQKLVLSFVIVNVLNNTGIENTNDISFSIYPNPVSNNLIVDGLKNNAPFFITDLNSKKAIEGNLNSNTNSIDVSNLQNGTYFINVNGEGRFYATFFRL